MKIEKGKQKTENENCFSVTKRNLSVSKVIKSWLLGLFNMKRWLLIQTHFKNDYILKKVPNQKIILQKEFLTSKIIPNTPKMDFIPISIGHKLLLLEFLSPCSMRINYLFQKLILNSCSIYVTKHSSFRSI